MTTTTLAGERGTSLWKIDPAHTSPQFTVRHLMISKVKGRFGSVAGTVSVPDGDETRAVVDVTIDAKSVDTGVGQRDDHLRSPDFFDVARYPTLTFKSESVERVGDDQLRVKGGLTIRGVTHEVALDVRELGTVRDPWGGERAGYSASTRINRRDYGLDWNQALEAGGWLVGEDVSIDLDVELVRESA